MGGRERSAIISRDSSLIIALNMRDGASSVVALVISFLVSCQKAAD